MLQIVGLLIDENNGLTSACQPAYSESLVAVDMGELSEQLVDYGRSVASRLDVEVSFLHVPPYPTVWKGFEKWIPEGALKQAKESAEKKIRYYIRKAEEKFPDLAHHEHKIIFAEGNPSEEIIKTACTLFHAGLLPWFRCFLSYTQTGGYQIEMGQIMT